MILGVIWLVLAALLEAFGPLAGSESFPNGSGPHAILKHNAILDQPNGFKASNLGGQRPTAHFGRRWSRFAWIL